MKKYFFVLAALAGMVMAGCSSQRQTAVTDAEAAAVRSLLDSREYTVMVSNAQPRSGRNINLTYDYKIQVSRDSLDSYLPYFGVGYSVPYGGGEGLIFEAPISEYSVREGKRGATEITFSARTTEDFYDYRLTVYQNGNASLTVTPNRKQGIDFMGKLKMDGE